MQSTKQSPVPSKERSATSHTGQPSARLPGSVCHNPVPSSCECGHPAACAACCDARPIDAEGSLKEDDIAVLNERLASARRAGPSGPAVEEEEEEQAGPSVAAEQQAQAAQLEQEQQQRQPPQELPDAFTRSTDEDLADALNKRIVEVASSLAGSMDDEEEAGPADELTGGCGLDVWELSKQGLLCPCTPRKRGGLKVGEWALFFSS